MVTRIGPPATQSSRARWPWVRAATRERRPRRPQITGQELRAMGINTDYAPDADVNVNPANPVIGMRSFSSDPKLVAEMVAAAGQRATRRTQVIATAPSTSPATVTPAPTATSPSR